jgi:type II secretory pathway predicted ATPase ExeA
MEKLIVQLANILKDYRSDEMLNPTPQIIQKWINQFTKENQQIVLKEMIYILNKTYISEERINNFLLELITSKKLINNNPKLFWSNVSLLNIQKDGQSQNIMVEKFKKLLWKQLKVNVAVNDYSKLHYIYLDDFLFSGMKLRTDLITGSIFNCLLLY